MSKKQTNDSETKHSVKRWLWVHEYKLRVCVCVCLEGEMKLEGKDKIWQGEVNGVFPNISNFTLINPNAGHK